MHQPMMECPPGTFCSVPPLSVECAPPPGHSTLGMHMHAVANFHKCTDVNKNLGKQVNKIEKLIVGMEDVKPHTYCHCYYS